jgi:hypothetical protein
MCFWGVYANSNYGWDRNGLEIGFVQNPYIRYYWSGGIELCTMMLDYYEHTCGEEFAGRTLVPIAQAVIDFFDKHYLRNGQGKIEFKPAMSLETWHNVINPLPEIAGLRYILKRLLDMDCSLFEEGKHKQWERLLYELPVIPEGNIGEKEILLPANELLEKERKNCENPELYAVFPYRIYGVGKPELETALATYEVRDIRENGCLCGLARARVTAPGPPVFVTGLATISPTSDMRLMT